MKHQLKYINHALLATLLATKALIAHFSRMVRSNLFVLHFGKSFRILPKAFASIVVRSASGIPSAVKCSWAESGSGLLLCYYDMKNK